MEPTIYIPGQFTATCTIHCGLRYGLSLKNLHINAWLCIIEDRRPDFLKISLKTSDDPTIVSNYEVSQIGTNGIYDYKFLCKNLDNGDRFRVSILLDDVLDFSKSVNCHVRFS